MIKKFKANGRLAPKKGKASIDELGSKKTCPKCGHVDEKQTVVFGEQFVCSNCGEQY